EQLQSHAEVGHGSPRLGQGDAEELAFAVFRREVFGAQDVVGIGDAPELFGVLEVGRRDVVEAVFFLDLIFGREGRGGAGRHEPAAEVDNDAAVGQGPLRRVDAIVAAGFGKHDSPQKSFRETPTLRALLKTLLVASTSLAIWWARKSENPGLVTFRSQ